jgi:polysaccharide export outer membrane protein
VLAPDVGDQVLQEYRIGPGDRLNITIFGHNDLSGEVQVDGSGRISMPLIGQLMANSKTIMELQEEVTATLDKDYIINPRVSVEVVNYRPFYILGQVNRPGSYSYIEGMTVRMAVAIAGGFTRRADEDVIVIILANDPEQVEYEVTQGGRVLPGDSIEVERRLF